jgi:hypothetical protein
MYYRADEPTFRHGILLVLWSIIWLRLLCHGSFPQDGLHALHYQQHGSSFKDRMLSDLDDDDEGWLCAARSMLAAGKFLTMRALASRCRSTISIFHQYTAS